ncbi:ANTR protein, partial [Rostratula benghalensis]|nr:ANTR protein [Rostratula benghalensis]
MKVKVCIGLILAIVVTACLCRPAAEAPGAAGDPHQLPASLVRRDWPESLSQEQKHLISQFLPHVFTELRDPKGYVHGDEGTEALHDHYYQDWMDFGRRSAEDSVDAA